MSLRKPAPLSVCFVPIPRFTLSPFALMIDALRLAADEGDHSRQLRCRWSVAGPTSDPIIASCGTAVTPSETYSSPQRFDYIVVCGGLLHSGPTASSLTRTFLREAAAAGVPLIGVCTGVFELLRAGLMDGRRCCVSWFHYWDLLCEFPRAFPVADRLFVVDGDRITCAGGVGALDLASWLIERHCGMAIAQKALHILQLDRGRPANTPQPQPPGWQPVENEHVRRALLLIEQNLSMPLSVAQMARRLGISERQLERAFQNSTGCSPRRASHLMRLRFALWLVTTSSKSVTAIAQEAGFSDLPHLSRAFMREFGARPSRIRAEGIRRVARRNTRLLESFERVRSGRDYVSQPWQGINRFRSRAVTARARP